MNYEILPEIKIECLEEAKNGGQPVSQTPKKQRMLPLPVSCAAAVLICISLIFHAAFIVAALAFLDGGKAEKLLISLVMPGFETISRSSSELYEESEEIKDETEQQSTVISSEDISTNAENGLALLNQTSYKPDINSLFASAKPLSAQSVSTADSSAPTVLIYHSHATESYDDGGEIAANGFRSGDNEKNTVAVGEVMSDVLRRCGIGVIHLGEQFDAEDWNAAYDKSAVAVADTLKKYPSITYIFDVHRDCIQREDGSFVRAVSSEGAAQLMLVCGTDEGGSGHSTWQENLSFALSLQAILWREQHDLMRPINLKSASFYQSFSRGALLLEVGCCGNTLTQAKRGGVIFACALADYIKGAGTAESEAMLAELCE